MPQEDKGHGLTAEEAEELVFAHGRSTVQRVQDITDRAFPLHEQTTEEIVEEIVAEVKHNLGLEDPVLGRTSMDSTELRLPTFEETLARQNDPFERANVEQRQRKEEQPYHGPALGPALNTPVSPQVEYRTDDQPEWSRALAESKASPNKVEYLLEAAARNNNPDAGAMARDALLAFQRLRAETRRKRIKFWTGWLVFLMLLAGVAGGVWYVLPNYIVSGRYTVPSDCSVELGKTTLTGKREYSYAYKSLFGYHLVDESTALEKTTINLKGDKLIILGWNKETGKTWRQNFGNGDLGAPPLKHADIYWFLTDKEMATVPYNALCR